jgi:hypothetical protein
MLFVQRAPTAIELQKPLRDLRRGAHRGFSFTVRNELVAKHRIAARFAQVSRIAQVLGVRKILRLDAEETAQPRQIRQGERPMVVLDLVEIARREAEPPREFGLANAAAFALAAQALAGEDLPGLHGVRAIRNIRNSTPLQ